jgi:diguanylate cyclase
MVLAAGKLLVSANQKLQADLEEAKNEIQRQREQADACLLESRTDALTNLANRRAFDLEISRAVNQRLHNGHAFSLIMIDIDHFKRINDQYGHMVGDQLLKGVARCVSGSLRDCDFVARYGGEEFVVIMPKTHLQDALKAAERVRGAIVENRFHVGDLQIEVSASLGVKEVDASEAEAQIIEKADAAMYAAKKGGAIVVISMTGRRANTMFQSSKRNLPTVRLWPMWNLPPSPMNRLCRLRQVHRKSRPQQ